MILFCGLISVLILLSNGNLRYELGQNADDAMAIFVALQSPEVEVIGLTTIYGNVYTTLATRNALHLVLFTSKLAQLQICQ